MMIEFQCRNQVFNPALGHGEPCDCPIIVPDSKIGELVLCPNCKEQTEVPFDYLQSSSAKKAVPPQPAAPASPANKKRPAHPASASPAKSGATSGNASKDDEYQIAAPFKRPSSDLSAINFGDESAPSTPPIAPGKRKLCAKCGQATDAKGRCTSCGFAPPKFQKATQPIAKIKVGLAGFQLWFVNTMSEAIPFKYLELGAHLSVGSIAAMMTFAALVGLGGIAGVALSILIGCLAGLYATLVLKGHKLARDPQARLSWYQKPLWSAILWLSRRMNWQDYDQRFADRTIIDLRGQGITDDHLPALENMKMCEVLDLERTPITDRGLRYLYGMENLHCVVLRKTNVTHEGVFRLQQTNPRLWIWY